MEGRQMVPKTLPPLLSHLLGKASLVYRYYQSHFQNTEYQKLQDGYPHEVVESYSRDGTGCEDVGDADPSVQHRLSP